MLRDANIGSQRSLGSSEKWATLEKLILSEVEGWARAATPDIPLYPSTSLRMSFRTFEIPTGQRPLRPGKTAA
jgi:hypothetical protein